MRTRIIARLVPGGNPASRGQRYRVPWPGVAPVWLLANHPGRHRFTSTSKRQPPWAWRAYEQARELWIIERDDRDRQEKLRELRRMAQRVAFADGLTERTWKFNAIALGAIHEDVACRLRLRAARKAWRELRTEILRRGRRDKNVRRAFSFLFERRARREDRPATTAGSAGPTTTTGRIRLERSNMTEV
jgi:hypothetical protein